MQNKLLYLILIFTFLGCADQEDSILSYDQIDRTVGTEGGIINFYDGGLPGESGFSTSQALVTLNIPVGALDKEVSFTVRKRELGIQDDLETWEILPNDIVFHKPIKLTMSFGMDQSEYASLNNTCFYKPMSIPIDASLLNALKDEDAWIEHEEYQLNEDDLNFEVQITDLKQLYFFATKGSNFDYEFCTENNNHVNIPLRGDHDVLIIPPGGVKQGTNINLTNLVLPQIVDYPQPTIDNYVILASGYGYKTIEANNTTLQNDAMLFLHADEEQARDVLLDWEKANNTIKILRIDPKTLAILEVLDYDKDLSELDNHLFATNIKELGAYVLGLPKENFELRFGGSIHVVATGGTVYDLQIEQTDFGGAFIDLLDVRYQLNVNPGKDETEGYFRLNVNYGSDLQDQVFPYYSLDFFIFKYYDNTDTERWIKFRNGKANLIYTSIDKEGGWIEGVIKGQNATSAYNESGEDVDLEVSFRLRIAQWYEL